MSNDTLLPCPFCAWEANADDNKEDIVYPSGTWWADVTTLSGEIRRYYRSHRYRAETDNPCWEVNCVEEFGGCGASISADSRNDVILKWNTRKGIA